MKGSVDYSYFGFTSMFEYLLIENLIVFHFSSIGTGNLLDDSNFEQNYSQQTIIGLQEAFSVTIFPLPRPPKNALENKKLL